MACKEGGIVQDWSWPFTYSLWCLFLTGKEQNSLARGELSLLLWVKWIQSLKIYLGKKMFSVGFWLFTLQSSWEKEQFVFNFAVLGEYKLCELGEKGFVEKMTAVCSRCFSECVSPPSWGLFDWMRKGVLSWGRPWNGKGRRSGEWMCRTGSEWDAQEVECKCYLSLSPASC